MACCLRKDASIEPRLGHEWHIHTRGRFGRMRVLAGSSKDGSHGTRTRDLRRDRPIRVRKRPTTDHFELTHLQGLCALPVGSLRIVA